MVDDLLAQAANHPGNLLANDRKREEKDTVEFSRVKLPPARTLFGRCQAMPTVRLAESMVLRRSMAMVMGPTPPGTGVIAPATS